LIALDSISDFIVGLLRGAGTPTLLWGAGTPTLLWGYRYFVAFESY
jgi:hypothetical protein